MSRNEDAGDSAAPSQAVVIELNDRLQDPRLLESSRGIQFCADLKSLSRDLDWESADEYSEALSELYETAAEMCPSTLGSHMVSAIDTAVERYTRCVASDELTSLHAALATVCLQQHVCSPHLRLFTHVSKHFPPINGTSTYFWNCSEVYASHKAWETAAMHAALALSQEPDATKWRLWVLYELIAYGQTRDLPKPVQSTDKCPLVAELATYFSVTNRTSGRALQDFCARHEQSFKSLGVWRLVKRCCISYYIQWLRRMAPFLGVISWDILAPDFNPMSLDELLAAGLEQYFTVSRSLDDAVFIEPKHSVRDGEKALRLLKETSLIAELTSQEF